MHKNEFPKFYLSLPISSPAAVSKFRKNAVYIGTGAGNATFLCFADSEYQKWINKLSLKNEESDDIAKNEKSDFVFISREIEHLRWIGKYIEGVLIFPEMTKRMRFHIYITIKDRANTLSSFLFWRALTLYNRQKEKKEGKLKSLTINLGRPNFDKLMNEIWVANDVRKHYVYACGPSPMIKNLQSVCLRKSDAKKNQIILNYETF